jgi:hypothetical protein
MVRQAHHERQLAYLFSYFMVPPDKGRHGRLFRISDLGFIILFSQTAEKGSVFARSTSDEAISKGDCFASLAMTERTFSALSLILRK